METRLPQSMRQRCVITFLAQLLMDPAGVRERERDEREKHYKCEKD